MANIPSDLTKFRIKKLLKKGYKLSDIANVSGVSISTLRRIDKEESKIIKGITHQAIEQMYHNLIDNQPLSYDVIDPVDGENAVREVSFWVYTILGIVLVSTLLLGWVIFSIIRMFV